MTDGQFIDRIDLDPNDGSFMGTAEVRVVAATNEQEKVRRLEDECDRLRDRVAELTRLLAEAQP
jgi:hypothetical protein